MGHVGENLVGLLVKEETKIIVSDIDESKVSRICNQYKVTHTSSNDIYKQEVDVFAPCALGAIINNESIEQIRCSIIAGSANNQLADVLYHVNLLKDKDILYAPDFLINAGGLMNVYFEMNGYNKIHVMAMVNNIYAICTDINKRADKENISTAIIAKQMAEERIKNIKEIKHGL